jgi:ABC-2 type transport system ATP-binding protein
MSRTPLISLRGVRKSYRSFELGPIELEVEAGYVVALVGPNGSGKSTLFGMLMGLIHPSSGEVRLFGRSYPKDEVTIKQRIGYVPERAVGHDDVSAKSLGDFVSYWYPAWDQRLYEDLIERSQIDPHKRYDKLSKGVQRRLSFAVAVATGPDLLLLDEPTSGVDPLGRNEMLEEISRFMQAPNRSRDRAVVFSTHVAEEVRRVADYVAVLVGGEFVGIYEKDALLERWKTLWVDGEPEGEIPGAVDVENGSMTRIVSELPHETAEALCAQGIQIVCREKVDLEETLSHLMRRSKEGANRRVPRPWERGRTRATHPGPRHPDLDASRRGHRR